MSTIYGNPLLLGGKKPTPLSVSTNGTWSQTEGYSPVNVNVPASAVTSGTKVITAAGVYDVTEFKSVRVVLGLYASASPAEGISYTTGLPNDWNRIKEIAKAISEASNSITDYPTTSIYVNNGNTWAYKITLGDTINVNNYEYAVMGFNNFALTNSNHYGGAHTTAGLTFGMVNCVENYKMNSTATNKGGWGKCLMRTSKMPTLKKGMPATLAQVKVPYVEGGVVVYSDDYMFLPSSVEVIGNSYGAPSEEKEVMKQFAYYINGGSKIKKLSGSTVYWWCRSIDENSNNSFIAVPPYSGMVALNASDAYGVAPCFCV